MVQNGHDLGLTAAERSVRTFRPAPADLIRRQTVDPGITPALEHDQHGVDTAK